ncbi:MAG: malate/lactate/ureidoglycolate dehydrogenase [Proteobacteria bacterium]|nr:MAG: malate/lactate/ureidoglycolate dehydrogenase [Pseudomonadota bacterium]
MGDNAISRNETVEGTATLRAEDLERLAADILDAAGCSRAEAQRVAHYLVSANLAGHDSHGMVRIPRYVQLLRDGLVIADQQVEVLVDTPVLAVVDGKYGFGQTVAPRAVQIGIEKCKQMGLSAVALRNSGHVGRVGDWAEMAAEAGLISVHFVNAVGSVLVAPFGSMERRFSTAPYCVGVPLSGRAPLVLDFATSVVAEGKVLVASQGGKGIPADALIGPDGATSDDPRLLYGDYLITGRRDLRQGAGALRAFGDHKGSGLAIMCEILGGALSGTGCTSPDRRIANGMFSLYVDPERIDSDGMFPEEVARYVAYVKQAKPAPPATQTLVPGEPEQRTKAQRLRDGVPITAETWRLLMESARMVGADVQWAAHLAFAEAGHR